MKRNNQLLVFMVLVSLIATSGLHAKKNKGKNKDKRYTTQYCANINGTCKNIDKTQREAFMLHGQKDMTVQDIQHLTWWPVVAVSIDGNKNLYAHYAKDETETLKCQVTNDVVDLKMSQHLNDPAFALFVREKNGAFTLWDFRAEKPVTDGNCPKHIKVEITGKGPGSSDLGTTLIRNNNGKFVYSVIGDKHSKVYATALTERGMLSWGEGRDGKAVYFFDFINGARGMNRGSYLTGHWVDGVDTWAGYDVRFKLIQAGKLSLLEDTVAINADGRVRRDAEPVPHDGFGKILDGLLDLMEGKGFEL